jgi:hypothetical protein
VKENVKTPLGFMFKLKECRLLFDKMERLKAVVRLSGKTEGCCSIKWKD